MNEFTYLDIYATKTTEYLLVVGFLVALAAVAALIRRRESGRGPRRRDGEGPR